MKAPKKKLPGSQASAPAIDLGQIEQVLAFMSDHGLEEFEYSRGDLHIRLKKEGRAQNAASSRSIPTFSDDAPIASSRANASTTTAPAPHAEPKAPTATAPADNLHVIKSPIVGTFYAGSSPDAGPFVKIGDIVEAGQTVCIVEAMKLMNEIEADISGEVVRVLVENGHPVEYGEPLFSLRPTGGKK